MEIRDRCTTSVPDLQNKISIRTSNPSHWDLGQVHSICVRSSTYNFKSSHLSFAANEQSVEWSTSQAGLWASKPSDEHSRLRLELSKKGNLSRHISICRIYYVFSFIILLFLPKLTFSVGTYFFYWHLLFLPTLTFSTDIYSCSGWTSHWAAKESEGPHWYPKFPYFKSLLDISNFKSSCFFCL
jgi:hypothetical protein